MSRRDPTCRCGHVTTAHDAGECWATPDGQQCRCSWYEPAEPDPVDVPWGRTDE